MKSVIPEDEKLLQAVRSNPTPDARRMTRFLDMPDLSRTKGSPIYQLVHKLLDMPDLKDFDVIEIPEIVPADVSFDLFNFAPDHPARSKSDTYYVDEKHILRTHDTVMWYYYLNDSKIKERIAKNETLGVICYGKVYRKDEIDRNHMNVFHQIDGWYLTPQNKKAIGLEDLEQALRGIALAVFGPDTPLKIFPDTFPYTNPSLQMEVEKNGKWLEVLGSGVVKGSVLEKFGVDSTKWNGCAFGPGIERLAMVSMELPDIRLLWSDDERVKKQLKLGIKFKEVSKYPPVIRDISFIVNKDFVPNNYFDLVRDVVGDMAEQMGLLDKYENDGKLGTDKVSYAYRITYRSIDKTLTNDEVNVLHSELEAATIKNFGATIR